MATPFSRRRCPYCGRTFRLGQCPIVATNKVFTGETADPQPASGAVTYGMVGSDDGGERWPIIGRPVLEIRRGRRLWDVLRIMIRGWRLAPVDQEMSLQDLPARACIRCNHPLPIDIDNRRIITIAVLGTKSAGKTHYLASAMYQASRLQLLRAVGCEQFEPDEPTAVRYHEAYFEPLFVRREQLPATDVDEAVRFSPLVYRIRFEGAKPCSLLLHDVSGEMLRNRRHRVRFAQFIYHADGAIFLIDPENLGLGPDHPPEAAKVGTYNQADLFISWADEARTDIPVAITLSKSDLVKFDNPMATDLFQDYPPRSGDDWGKEMREIGIRVRRVFEQLEAYDLLAAVRLRGGQVSFHAVAALGSPPNPDGTVSTVRPQRCLDPLITLLTRIPGVVEPLE